MTIAKLYKELQEVKTLLNISDLISEEDAANLLGVSVKSIQNKVSAKQLEGTYIINAIGKRNFFKSKLLNLK